MALTVDMTEGSILPGVEYLSALALWRGDQRFNLGKISGVLRRLGYPHNEPSLLHVTGTNGKGSVSTLLASMLGAAGHSVGLNISPHLLRMNERIVVDGQPVSDTVLNTAAEAVRWAAETEGVQLSFHEGITATAFVVFRDLEWAVLEVGLGGRLDASNVVKYPKGVAIVSIDFDHQHILGESLDQIATEKFGIVKRGTVCVTGPLSNEALAVGRSRCALLKAPLLTCGEDFWAEAEATAIGTFTPGLEVPAARPWRLIEKGKPAQEFSFRFPGIHQLSNAAVAVTLATHIGLDRDAIERGLENAFWPGRLEHTVLNATPVIIDCAHNIGGVRALVRSLREEFGISGGVRLVFGVLDTKDWRTMLAELLPVVAECHIVKPDNTNAVPPEMLAQFISSFDISVSKWDRDLPGLFGALLNGAERSPIVVAGSMYYLGEVRKLLKMPDRPYWFRAVSGSGR